MKSTQLFKTFNKIHNLLYFKYYLADTSPSLYKSWNKDFVVVQIADSFLFNTFLTQYSLHVTRFRLAILYFTNMLFNAKLPKILFVGQFSFPIAKKMLENKCFPEFRKYLFGMDHWFSGFLTINRPFRFYDQLISHFDYSYITAYAQSSYIQSKKMRQRLFFFRNPSTIIFFQTNKSSYFAGLEVLKKRIPSIGFISPESQSFGFSGVAYTVGFPFSNIDQNRYLVDLYTYLLDLTISIRRFYKINLLNKLHYNKSMLNKLKFSNYFLRSFRKFSIPFYYHSVIKKTKSFAKMVGRARSSIQKTKNLHQIFFSIFEGFLIYLVSKKSARFFSHDEYAITPNLPMSKFISQFFKILFLIKQSKFSLKHRKFHQKEKHVGNKKNTKTI